MPQFNIIYREGLVSDASVVTIHKTLVQLAINKFCFTDAQEKIYKALRNANVLVTNVVFTLVGHDIDFDLHLYCDCRVVCKMNDCIVLIEYNM